MESHNLKRLIEARELMQEAMLLEWHTLRNANEILLMCAYDALSKYLEKNENINTN